MRGRVRFTVGGVERELRYTYNRICALEEALGGLSLDAFLQRIGGSSPTFRDARLFFWAGLGNGTVEEAGDMIDELGVKDAMAKAIEAFQNARAMQSAGDAPGNG